MRVLQALTPTLLLFGTGTPAQLQQTTPVWSTPAADASAARSHHDMDSPVNSREMQERLEKVRQSDRQRKMIADTNRLLTLATELKAATDKLSKEPPSTDTIRKIEEIEKLARSVKDRMKG